MAVYNLNLEVTYSKQFAIEADNIDEAIDKLSDMYGHGDVSISVDDDNQFEIWEA